MNSRDASRSAGLLLAVATVAVVAVIPDWPHRHPGDPSYWGLVAFVLLAVGLLALPRRSWEFGGTARRAIIAFLAVVPLVYVADWIRWGGSEVELAIQLGGLAAWLSAAYAARRSDVVLWMGCAAHALWDAAHFGRVDFVPEWYAAACLAADIGLGAFVLIELKARSHYDRP